MKHTTLGLETFGNAHKIVVILIAIALSIAVPFMGDWHNPAGAQPQTIFGALMVMSWIAVLVIIIETIATRKKREFNASDISKFVNKMPVTKDKQDELYMTIVNFYVDNKEA